MSIYILLMVIVLAGETHKVPVVLGDGVPVIFNKKSQCEAAAKALEPAVKEMLNKAATLTTECLERKGPDAI